MKILAIETSCDETAISVVSFDKLGTPKVLSHLVSSQTKIHEPFGGVVPNLAAREHQTNLIPILKKSLQESGLLKGRTLGTLKGPTLEVSLLEKILERESELSKQFQEFIPTIVPPAIDVIAVTVGPGLEPALWVGINFAKALALVWQKPLVPVNHMEGHIHSSILQNTRIDFPTVALLISGGHTELILMKGWGNYQLLGQTRDDAVGEAFDKVARLLGLPYPGGPQISALADQFESSQGSTLRDPKGRTFKFPRPMIDSGDYDFSFSGLKTSVRYKIEQIPKLTDEIKEEIAYEFQEAVIEVLVKKTMRALREYGAKTLIVGGGVIANKKLRAAFESATKGLTLKKSQGQTLNLLIPEMRLTTDNATMIALAAYQRLSRGDVILKNLINARKEGVFEPTLESLSPIRAEGNLRVC